MATMLLDCPHCGGTNAAFTSIAETRIFLGDYCLFATCNNCRMPVILRLINPDRTDSPCVRDGNPADWGWRLVAAYPEPTIPTCPAHTPDAVCRFYMQAAANLRPKMWDAAGMACRKALDVATLVLEPDSRTKPLARRIDALAATGRITADLAIWAHEIRALGNEAAHDPDEFAEADARDLFAFTELLLMYVFTLPGMLAERRAKRLQEA